jgi:hypothetical protein
MGETGGGGGGGGLGKMESMMMSAKMTKRKTKAMTLLCEESLKMKENRRSKRQQKIWRCCAPGFLNIGTPPLNTFQYPQCAGG